MSWLLGGNEKKKKQKSKTLKESVEVGSHWEWSYLG
jgi:hypothetical protein